MARPPATIHVAYSASTKHGATSYSAKAAVTDEGFKSHHTVCSGIGDSALEAVDDAINYVMKMYKRDDLPPPENTIMYGRVPRIDIQNVSFIGRH